MTDAQYIERLKSRCKVSDTGCWEFQGFIHPKGYGEMSYRGDAVRVHRLSFMLHKGPIPDGHQVCHSCDNRRCCNPDHLWTGTNNDNVQDMRRKKRGNKQKKVNCWRGHPLSGENLYVNARGHRACKTCQRIRLRMKAGWSYEQAVAVPLIPSGYSFIEGRLPVTENETRP